MKLSISLFLSATCAHVVSGGGLKLKSRTATYEEEKGIGSGSGLGKMQHRSLKKLKQKQPPNDDFETKSKQAKEKDKSDESDEWIRKPSCSWERGEKFMYDGVHGECVVPPDTDERPTWYSLEEGTCSIFGANATHLEFNIHHAESGLLFSAVPYKFVLDPQESNYFSDLNLFKEKAVAVLVRGEGINEILHVGVLDMTAEGNGLLVGKRIHGDDLDIDHDASTVYSIVLGSVDRLRSWSAAGVGMCTSDGDGRVSIEVEDFLSFKEDRFDIGFPMDFFEDVNAAIYSKNLGYEVFTIDKVENANWVPGDPHHTGSIEGEVYFSTRVGTWDTAVGSSSSVTEKCFIFVDDTEVYSRDYVSQVAKDNCKANYACSFFSSNCLPEGCGCAFTSSNCGNNLHCIRDQNSWAYGSFDSIVAIWNNDPRYCWVYSEGAKILNAITAAVIVIAAVAVVVVATGGTATAVGTTLVKGATEGLTSAGLRALVQEELAMTAKEFFELGRTVSAVVV